MVALFTATSNPGCRAAWAAEACNQFCIVKAAPLEFVIQAHRVLVHDNFFLRLCFGIRGLIYSGWAKLRFAALTTGTWLL